MSDRQQDHFLVAALGAGARREPPAFQGTLEGGAGIALAVLDGTAGGGSGNAGEHAAILAAETIFAHLSTAPLPEGDAACEERVRGALMAAHHAIGAHGAAHHRYQGMGCAATLAWITGARLHVAQAGDTRAYVLRAGRPARGAASVLRPHRGTGARESRRDRARCADARPRAG